MSKKVLFLVQDWTNFDELENLFENVILSGRNV